MHSFGSLNFLAILVAALLVYLLGAAWHSKRMIDNLGEQTRTEDGALGRSFLQFLSAFLFCFTLALLIQGVGAKTLLAGGWVGFLVGCGILFPAALSEQLQAGEIRRNFWMGAWMRLVGSVLAGAFLALMR